MHRRRGIVRVSITRLATRLSEYEGKTDQPSTLDRAHHMSQRLNDLDSEFKCHHCVLVDLIDDEEGVLREQKILDEHNVHPISFVHDNDIDNVFLLAARIEHLIYTFSSSEDSDSRKIASRRLFRLGKKFASIKDAISSLTEDTEPCLVQQYGEQIQDIKKELVDTHNSLLTVELNEADELAIKLSQLEGDVFYFSLRIKRLTYASSTSSSSPTPLTKGTGVKLPKL